MRLFSKRLIVVFIVLACLLIGCEEDPIISEQAISWQNEICYAYYTVETQTNNFGGITGKDLYLILGVVKHNGEVVQYEYSEYDMPPIMQGDSNTIIFYTTRTTFESGRYHDRGLWKEIYLTKDFLKNLEVKGTD